LRICGEIPTATHVTLCCSKEAAWILERQLVPETAG
jgi:hypothetical protein